MLFQKSVANSLPFVVRNNYEVSDPCPREHLFGLNPLSQSVGGHHSYDVLSSLWLMFTLAGHCPHWKEEPKGPTLYPFLDPNCSFTAAAQPLLVHIIFGWICRKHHFWYSVYSLQQKWSVQWKLALCRSWTCLCSKGGTDTWLGMLSLTWERHEVSFSKHLSRLTKHRPNKRQEVRK